MLFRSILSVEGLGDDYYIVGVLHDVLEDTPLKEQDLFMRGLNGRQIQQLEALNRKNFANYAEYIINLAKHPLLFVACQVKLEDLKDNMSDLEEGSLKDKYRLSKYLLE